MSCIIVIASSNPCVSFSLADGDSLEEQSSSKDMPADLNAMESIASEEYWNVAAIFVFACLFERLFVAWNGYGKWKSLGTDENSNENGMDQPQKWNEISDH